MTKKIVKRTDANNETLYFYTHSDAVDVGEGNATISLTNALNNKASTSDVQTLSNDTLRKSPQSLSSQEKSQVHNNIGTESFVDDRAVRYDDAQVLGSEEKTQALTNLGLNGVDDEPTAGSDKLVKSGGVKNELALGAVYDVSAKNPTAGPNNDGKFESLSALLSDANLNTLIPAAVRKGGMSIKFIQSSDNKYLQYRLTSDEWTTDTNAWSFCGDEVLTDNPEFVRMVTDADGRILYGVKTDGNFVFGVGVPQSIKDYVLSQKAVVDADVLAEKTRALAAEATKVDKEEGKSLIDEEYAETKSSVESPEFIEVTVDAEDKIIEGLHQDGTKIINTGLKVLGNMEVSGAIYKVIENPEYIAAWLDAENHVVFGIETDGKIYVGDANFLDDIANIKAFVDNVTEKDIDWDVLSSFKSTEHPEFIEAKIDADGKVVAGRASDGSAFELVGISAPKMSIDECEVSNIEDPEGRTEIKTDAKSKILSYRDANGVLHEDAGIETSQLKLADDGITDLERDLKEHGFTDGFGDWSDKKELHIAEPYCAFVNITGVSDMPQQKYSDDDRPHAYMQFWDMSGNYFKKEVLINAQGRSTMAHPKKNIAIDICNNNGWDDGDTFSLQIGDWVPQDSFHLKAFYNDPFRCLSAVAYKLYDEVLKSRGEFDDYVWKRALLDLSNVTATSTGCADAEEAIEGWNTNARCFPMGFPCIVYLNGDFYGIYSWQLKKHRDNYMMSKKKTKHIHLDGLVNPSTILNADGDSSQIIWTTDNPEGIEIRNPKPKKKKDGWEMTMMDGTKYDADANGGELIDSTSPNWDATNESHVKSAEVKQYILNLSKAIPALADAYSTYQASSKTDEDKAAFKEVFETYFDVDNLIDYLIFSDVLANYDGFSQNVQWITYNGVKWYLCAYDLDGVMGNWWQLNDTIVAPVNTHYSFAQFQYIPIFYNTELEARYKELRDIGIISVSNIINLVENWLKRIGAKETFEKEWEKWSGFIKNDNIHRLYKWLQISISNMDILYHYN